MPLSKLARLALQIYTASFQRFLGPTPFVWNPKNETFVFISDKKQLRFWRFSVSLWGLVVMGLSLIWTKELYNAKSHISVLNILFLAGLTEVGGLLLTISLGMISFGREFIQAWSWCKIVSENLRKGTITITCFNTFARTLLVCHLYEYLCFDARDSWLHHKEKEVRLARTDSFTYDTLLAVEHRPCIHLLCILP
jgi:hypothetical protein